MRKNIKAGIYCIENIINNKKYIGQSVDVDGRWSKHQSCLNKDNHDNDYLQHSWDKYGKENFKFYILEYCEKDELDEKEIYYMNLYNTMNREYGYNLKSGGQMTNQLSEEVRNKISESNKKVYENSDLRKTRSIDALNQWANPEIKKKIMGENNGMYGKHHSEESRRKMSENKKGKPSKRKIPVLCVELNRVFQSMTDAANEIGCIASGISNVCRGKQKTCAGYHWQFITENNIS